MAGVDGPGPGVGHGGAGARKPLFPRFMVGHCPPHDSSKWANVPGPAALWGPRLFRERRLISDRDLVRMGSLR